MRVDGRAWNELRPVHMTPGFIKYPEGSVLIQTGGTWVLCNATAEGAPFSRHTFDEMLDLAWSGIEHLLAVQRGALREGAARDEAPA